MNDMTSDEAFNRLMDAHQTIIRLKAGNVLTQEMVDDILLVERDYRENDERNTDAFHKGYEAGLERGSNADTAKLIEERDEARDRAMIAERVNRARDSIQVKSMVERFLSWKLPANFNPDNGISATRPNYAPNIAWEPTGTNLFDYTQAEAMVRHMLDPASADTHPKEPENG